MQLFSTKNKEEKVSLKEAVLKGLPSDNGLFMLEEITPLPQSFFDNIENYSFQELSFEVCRTLLQGAIPDDVLREIVFEAIDFPAPLVSLDDDKYILELFHGPSLAFKDFGARFMARLMSYFNQGNDKELVILVATSGDTGGAVASGFYQTPNTQVVILYPSGKVSLLQEKQLTTLGHNITALEVDGTFDDCQAMVKKAFLDDNLTSKVRLTSANSINISRLIPQSFYYFEAYKQIKKYLKNSDKLVFSIPSGNFGNLTAGLFAKRMGLPVYKFIAATNANDIVPAYLSTGEYKPKPSVRTISNAMDVGNPSNFARMEYLYGFTWNNMKQDIAGFSYDDSLTMEKVREVYNKYNYTIDPHGAVGYAALQEYQRQDSNIKGIVLETAHPAKFIDEVEKAIDTSIDIPERLEVLRNREKKSISTNTEYATLKSILLDRFS